MRILITGGGIGGLTTALCCLHFGHEVYVFEQTNAITDIGAGIQIPPNAMKVLSALDLSNNIVEYAVEPKSIEARMGMSGWTLFRIPLAAQSISRWGAPYYHIHRADYVAALLAALLERAPDALTLGADVSTYQQNRDGVTLTLEDGREFTGDVLIGADGIHSTIRTQMHGTDKPRYTGNMAWRVTVPLEKLGDLAPYPTACAWMGRGKHGVTYQLRRGEIANFVGVVECAEGGEESWSQAGRKAEALQDFAGWHPIITKILQEADSVHRWALCDRKPLPYWADGRVGLLGDSAHPMLPFLAQGAAMAVEDAWAVARALSKADRSASDSLRAFQTARFQRASRVQAASRANAKTFHRRSLPARLLTYGPMWIGGHLLPTFVHRRMDWLYGYDVTRLDI